MSYMLTGWWIHPYISVRQWTFLCVMLFVSISNFFKENGWKSLRFKFEKQTKDLQAECLDIQCVQRYPNGPTQNSVDMTNLELVPHQWSLLTKPLIITQLQSLPSKNQQSRRFSHQHAGLVWKVLVRSNHQNTWQSCLFEVDFQPTILP